MAKGNSKNNTLLTDMLIKLVWNMLEIGIKNSRYIAHAQHIGKHVSFHTIHKDHKFSWLDTWPKGFFDLWIFLRREEFTLYKLIRYALDWREWTQFHRIQDKVCSWPRMKKTLGIEFFPRNYNVILCFTKQDYMAKKSYSMNCIDELYIQPSREDITFLGINNIEPSFEENLKVINKDEKSCKKLTNWSLKIILFKRLMKRSKKMRWSWLRRMNESLNGILWKIQLNSNMMISP